MSYLLHSAPLQAIPISQEEYERLSRFNSSKKRKFEEIEQHNRIQTIVNNAYVPSDQNSQGTNFKRAKSQVTTFKQNFPYKIASISVPIPADGVQEFSLPPLKNLMKIIPTNQNISSPKPQEPSLSVTSRESQNSIRRIASNLAPIPPLEELTRAFLTTLNIPRPTQMSGLTEPLKHSQNSTDKSAVPIALSNDEPLPIQPPIQNSGGVKTPLRYWGKDEHKRYLEALKLYELKDVKSISKYVRTRTPTQVRTHTQKYLLKLQREQHPQLFLEQFEEP